ncbi:MAG TPA: cation:proton antiporter [Solirubrobacteraceae bacterium]|nr:cation:proton antiporter [Solirubrobacteraceae bacterium]
MPPDWLLAVLDVAAIAAVAYLGGLVMQSLGQPRIAGEMTAVFAAGLLLGGQIAGVVPGQQAGGRIADLFPDAAVAVVTAVGGLGLILYMLLVGITIDPEPMRERAGAIALLTVATIGSMVLLAVFAAPLLVGAGGWKPAGVSDGAFTIALAAGLAANGVPIVARVLEDRAMARSALGAIVIAAATCVTGLALIGAAVAIDGGGMLAGGRVALRAGVGLLVLALVLAVVRSRSFGLAPAVGVAGAVTLAVLSGLAGDALLSSLLIGPLAIGVAVRTGGGTALAVERCLGVVVRRVMLPVFLGLAALRTDLRELDADALAPALALVGGVIAIKLVVAYAAARAAGFATADARAIGALLQCGGIMTIAISLELLNARIIDARLHATLTLVGLVSTIAAGPLLPRSWIRAADPVTPATRARRRGTDAQARAE